MSPLSITQALYASNFRVAGTSYGQGFGSHFGTANTLLKAVTVSARKPFIVQLLTKPAKCESGITNTGIQHWKWKIMPGVSVDRAISVFKGKQECTGDDR